MKKSKRILALALTAAMALSLAACGPKEPAPAESKAADPAVSQGAASGEAVYRYLYSSEVQTFNYLYTGTQNDFQMSANCVDCLVEYDSYGVMIPSLAESWEPNDDNTEWTFHIRKGVKWVDKTGAEVAEVKAQDWVDAAYYILDANNDSGSEYNWDVAQVTNAHNYYEYTAYLLALETATDGTDENGNPAKLDENGEEIPPQPTSVWRLSDNQGRCVLDPQGNFIVIDPEDRGAELELGVFDYAIHYGMQHADSSRFLATDLNGQLYLGTGEVKRGLLEMSNTDLTQEFIKVIESQRAYSFCLKMVTTSDEIETTINGLR